MMKELRLRKENFIDAAWSFLFTLIIGILPTWGMAVIFKFYKQPIVLNAFTANGEFALYSASMMAAILYISAKDYLPLRLRNALKQKKYSFVIKGAVPFQNLFMFLSISTILLSTFLFMGVVIAKLPGVQGLSPDIELLSMWSLILFGLASLISFFTNALDNAASANDYTDTDYQKDIKKEQAKLDNELDQLLKES